MLPKLFQEVVKNLTRFINFWKTMEKPPKSYLLYYSGLASLTTRQPRSLLMLHVHHGLSSALFESSYSNTLISTMQRDRPLESLVLALKCSSQEMTCCFCLQLTGPCQPQSPPNPEGRKFNLGCKGNRRSVGSINHYP